MTPALGADLAALADAQMPRHRRLTADLYEVLEDRGARDAHLGHDDAAASEPDVVADLNQVIDACAGTDDGVARRSSVDGRIGTDLHIVLHDHPPKLRNAQEPGLRGGEAEPLLADPRARIDVDARSPADAWLRLAWAPIRQSRPMVTPRPIEHERSNATARADLRPPR